MKKILFVMCLLMTCQLVSAKKSFDTIFAECKEVKGAMNLNLTKDMLKMAMAMQKDKGQLAIMEKIDNMKMVIIPSPDAKLIEQVNTDISNLEEAEGYTKTIVGEEKDKGISQQVLIRAENTESDHPIVREFVIMAVVNSKGQQALLLNQIVGNFNVDDMEAILKVASRW